MSIFCPLLSNLFIKKEGIKIEPDTAIVHLTNHCNLRCKTCYLPQAKTELDLSGWIKSLNILAHNEIKSVILIGGEPLSSPIFTDVMVYASNLFKNIEVQTNGTVMPPTLIETIVNRNIKNINFFVSIDDIKNGKNYEEDTIRGEGVLKQAILFIKKLKLYDINVGIRSTLLQDNNYFGLTKLAKSLKVPIVFVRFIPIGRGKQLNAPSKERLKEVYDFIKFQEHATLFDCPYYIYNEKLFRKFKDIFLHRGICPFLAGRRIVLDTEANVYGCQMLMQYPFGNLFKHRFSDIITNKDEFITKTFQGINEQCNGCRVYSFCKGGCFIYTLNQMGGDPYCVIGG